MFTSLLLGCFAAMVTNDTSVQPANPNSTQAAKSVLQYLCQLPDGERERVLSGQHCGRGK